MRLRAAPDGHDINEVDKNQVFSSDIATHSIYAIVTGQIVNPNLTFTYTHNLGYKPKVWAMCKDSTAGNVWHRLPDLGFSGYIDYYITDTTVVIEATWIYNYPLDLKIMIFTRTFTPF